jgi:hypothetical protein
LEMSVGQCGDKISSWDIGKSVKVEESSISSIGCEVDCSSGCSECRTFFLL